MSEPIVLNETLGQGIFASEREMTEIEEYLRDVRDNGKEYNSALYVQGVFSFEDNIPVENWLLNSIENFKGPYFIRFEWKE